MKKLAQEKQLRRTQRLKILATLVLAVTFLLAAVQLLVSNRLANLGVQIEEESAKAESLSSQNRLLEEELRQKESLANISQKAKELGFVETKSIYYLVPQIPVAMK